MSSPSFEHEPAQSSAGDDGYQSVSNGGSGAEATTLGGGESLGRTPGLSGLGALERFAQSGEIAAHAVGAEQERDAEHGAGFLAAAPSPLEVALALKLDGSVLGDLTDVLIRQILEVGGLEEPQGLSDRCLA